MSLAGTFTKAWAVVNANSAEILTGLGIAGVILTGVTAGEARLKADDILVEIENERYEIDGPYAPPLTFKEKFTSTWWCYILPCMIGGLSITCIIGSHKIQGRKLAALASAYSLTDGAFKEYREKIKEKFGDKKYDEVDTEISQDHCKNFTMVDPDILQTTQGNILVHDRWSGQKFFSNADAIHNAVDAINKKIRLDLCASLNDFYNELCIDDVDCGNLLGWNILYDDDGPEVKLNCVLDKERIPMIEMSFVDGHEPAPNYNVF